jgi:integral membrane protein
MTEPTGQPAPTRAAPRTTGGRPAVDARARLTRYRVMAFVTGTMLLVLCLEMVLKYVFHAGGVDASGSPEPVLGTWIAIVHGWIYVVYLVTVVQLWSAMRWSLGRLVTMALAGVVPVMSFILERRVHAEAVARLDAAR